MRKSFAAGSVQQKAISRPASLLSLTGQVCLEGSASFFVSYHGTMLKAAARELTTISSQFEQTLSAFPDKAAIFSGGESLSFRQLHVEAASAAQALSSLGFQGGTVSASACRRILIRSLQCWECFGRTRSLFLSILCSARSRS